jgi:uncharacterized protein (DUF736 family)
MENSNNNKSDWSKRDIGALWKRESSTQKYLSGYVKVDELGIEREVKVVVFSNKNKKDNLKAPDYRIYLSVPKDSLQSNTSEIKKSQDSQPESKQKKSSDKPDLKKELIEEEDEVL